MLCLAPKVTEEYRKIIHDKILDAAQNLFTSKGYHETSMDDIVKESGLSKGGIYGHFESKEKLFLAVQQRKLTSSLVEMESIFDQEDSASTKLRKILDHNFSETGECSREKCQMDLEIMFAASRMESSRVDMEKRFESWYGFWTTVIEEGIKKGEFNGNIDPEAVASILHATVGGLNLHWMVGHEFDWPKIREALFAMIMKGIGA